MTTGSLFKEASLLVELTTGFDNLIGEIFEGLLTFLTKFLL